MAQLETKTDNDIVHHFVSGELTVSELVEMVVKYNEAPGKKNYLGN